MVLSHAIHLHAPETLFSLERKMLEKDLVHVYYQKYRQKPLSVLKSPETASTPNNGVPQELQFHYGQLRID